ncbi:NrsF family protein [Allorhizobium sp. BGMRC 0089]|uniref:NrsF family protein n=1 Tax=Allorhizobium sonneratiae TaxID=2934936 RepID=UPI0020333C6D|nr:NrsF family protein [Allorhizobium sonneratiae]MCM2291185.1 NrsF family protein [Allorhizobium sonneratiae]
MKTDDLITLLTQDTPVHMRLGRRLALALVPAILFSACVMLVTIGLRPHLEAALETVRVPFKIVVTLLLAMTASCVVFRIGKPGVPLRAFGLCLLLPLCLLILAVAMEMAMVPEGQWFSHWLGHNAAFCVFFVPVLSLAPLFGFLFALKHGAPENPGLAGAAAGLAAGGIAAAIYAWHCPDDSPFFLATWYGIAITLVTLIGYGLGRKLLRW